VSNAGDSPGPPRRRLRRRLAILAVLLVAGVAVVATAACSCVVTPPAVMADPVPVAIVDYGRHASLVLPDGAHRSVEYAYGEWNWFALDKSEWYDTFGTMLMPTRGALGRRRLETTPDDPGLVDVVDAESITTIPVDRTSADALRTRLDDRFAAAADTEHFQPRYDLTFVHDDDAYHMLNNCNQVLLKWLEELGCETSGPGLRADFEMREPPPPPPPAS